MAVSEMEKMYWERYHLAARKMQSGVAHSMSLKGEESPKHLRVGVNAALVQNSGLGALLINKGLITSEEYAKAMAEGMEMEVARYEAILTEAMGMKVVLEPCGAEATECHPKGGENDL